MYKINFKFSSALPIISILFASLMVFSFGYEKKEEKEIGRINRDSDHFIDMNSAETLLLAHVVTTGLQ